MNKRITELRNYGVTELEFSKKCQLRNHLSLDEVAVESSWTGWYGDWTGQQNPTKEYCKANEEWEPPVQFSIDW